MSNPWFYAILAGIFTTIEASINARLGKIVTPSIATLHSLMTGVVFIFVLKLVRGTLSGYGKIIFVSPQWLIGGFFGAFIIYFATKAIPALGVSNALTIIVASQLISGFVIDAIMLHNQVLQIQKVAGLVLLLIGVYFIIK